MDSAELKQYILANAEKVRTMTSNPYNGSNDIHNIVPIANDGSMASLFYNDGLATVANKQVQEKSDRLLFTNKNFGGTSDQYSNTNNVSQQLNETKSEIGKFFFGSRNISFLQSKIKEQVYNDLQVLISDQNEVELFKVMQFVYTNYLVSDYTCTEGSPAFIQFISGWNNEVLKIVIPNIEKNIQAYQGYAKFVTDGVQPVDYPINMSVKGSKTLVNPYFSDKVMYG